MNFFFSPKNGGKKKGNRIFRRGKLGCVLIKSFHYQSTSGTQSGQDGKWNFNVFCFLTEELMLVKHIRSSIWFCKSFLLLFLSCMCWWGGQGAGGSVLSTMTGRVCINFSRSGMCFRTKEQWRQREEIGA